MRSVKVWLLRALTLIFLAASVHLYILENQHYIGYLLSVISLALSILLVYSCERGKALKP